MRELLRRRRLQLRRHRRRPAARAARWPSGSSTASRPATSPRSTSAGSRRSTATTAGCTTGSREVLGLHYEIPWPNREMRTARPVPPLAAATTCSAGERQASAARWAGSGPTSSRPRAGPGRSSTPGASRTGCRGRPPNSASTRTAVTVFDQTSFSKYLLVGPDAEAALQWLCTADVGRAGRAHRLHRDAQRARHLRVRRDRHPDGRRRVPHRQQRRHHRAGQGPHPPPPAGRRTTTTRGRHLVATRCSA